ncbi:protein translocase subunit secF [Faunimonas pinastri]|uniref:Protein-export membrane protein SecF n=1 Tax=Faunimonas pinastri TaxID=1855383 RepID=A0A1H9CR69_9HYPH|nr:protein translocase subunit secF [Faunimonas pinastri]
MRFAKIGLPVSLVLMVASLVLLFTVGLNEGIDFKGGTVIEVQSKAPTADLADIRSKVDSLGLGAVEVQGFGTPNDVLLRVSAQSGAEGAQEQAVQKIRSVLGADQYTFRRVEVVGPRVSGELAYSGTMSVVLTIVGIMAYIWIRFEWQFALGAVASLVHDVILTIGFFAVSRVEFNLTSIAAILTIVGYSLNDTVVVFDRVREVLRRYKSLSISEVIDQSTNQTLARTILTSVTTLIALLALFFFGGEVIRSFTAAMIFGVLIGTYSSIFIASPTLIFFHVRPKPDKPATDKQASAKPKTGVPA